ncbi:dynein axonemal heavy chain 7 [Xylocopa sonorina]|uniref:dynein axonemal heavy chain 7 n=1 Tax=Xylocopa sonorina TaxID=1818115 RepID=UPI00403AC5E2
MDIGRQNVHQSHNLNTISSISDNSLMHDKVKICLKCICIQEFPTDWRTAILDLLPKKYRRKYYSLIESMLEEVRETYVKDTQDFLCKVVLSNPREMDNYRTKMNYTNRKFSNERNSFNYNTFLKHRKMLEKTYFLSLESIRIIVNSAQLKLPAFICNFEYYRNFGLMSFAGFQNMISKDIRKGSLAITNYFYTEVSKAVVETQVLKNINKRRAPNVMKCITNIFVQQILNIMMKSIDHMLNTMSAEYRCPQIKFQLIMQDDQLLLDPSVEKIYSEYHNVIESIGSIAQDLIPLEELLNMKTNLRYIKIKLPDCYMKESHNKLQVILDNLFKSVNEHIASIAEEFHPIYASNSRKRISLLISEKMKFDLYLQHIQKYNGYLIKANSMVMNTYHTIGKLEQRKANEALRKEACNIIDSFLTRLVRYHQQFNRSICSDFEELRTKALDVQRDAKSLIELTDYMTHASQVLVNELECKIQNSIRMLCTLIDITVLSEDHVQLNKDTINWLHEIEPVFKQSNVLCEAMKNELEDDTQKRINNLNLKVDEIIPQLSVLDDMDDINSIEEYFEHYKGLLKQVNQIDYEMRKINEEETLFKFPETEFPSVIELHEIVISFHDLICNVYQWRRDNSVWLDGPFEWLNAGVIESKTLNYFETITEMNKTFKTKIKLDVTANKCFKFSGIADDPDPLQQPAPLKLCWQALNEITNFKQYLPLVTCMCNPALEKRHWVEMSMICNFDLTPNAGTNLRKLISFNLMNDIEKYSAISIGANKELELHKKLSDMIKEWDKISFEISFDKQTGMNIFSNLEDIESMLESHLIVIEEMQTSNFIKQIAKIMTDFFESLVQIQEIISRWDYIQTLLVSLNCIFRHPSIEVHLVNECLLYNTIVNDLKDIQNKLSHNSTFAGINDTLMLKSLLNIIEKLECINQKITNYIEIKRLYFPRFYFLSDKEIQEILFDYYNLETPYIQKCFEGIKKVKVDTEKSICFIISDYGEKLCLEQFNLSNDEDGEKHWIYFENKINNTLKQNIFESYQIFEKTFTYNNIINFPSMVIVCTFQLYWTIEVQKCLAPYNSEALSTLYSKYIDQLNNLTSALENYSINKFRNLLMSLIVIVIQQKDIIKLLLDKNISEVTDFEWVAQLRYYLVTDYVNVSTFNTIIQYGYEYSYYEQRIINTPLTDRCFHTLIQAYEYHLYGALTGPSATGKSETIKSLAKAIAIQFRTFNCISILSFDLLSCIFKGFIACGAWICFENFDILHSDLLSRITQTIICFSQAVTTNLKTIMFNGTSLKLNPTGHICIITKLGLSKCSNIPDNLKTLFRTVSMVVPDMKRIVEVKFSAGGISNSKLLTLKLITLYKILSEQLWCELCNIFNLYSMKVIIKSVIYLKRSYPDENETALLLRSLIDTSLPKLCNVDIHIFKNIVHNMFPDTPLLPPNYAIFLETLEAICSSKSIHVHDAFKLKVIQLFELMYVHRSLLLVGNPFVGKTEILNVLQLVLSALYKQDNEFGSNVDIETIVPSTIDINHFFGQFDKKSKIWKDGICSKIFRFSSENNTFTKRWIIFDGLLNNTWIENLHTVVDTNETLYLSSGEKININNSLSIIFETTNIQDTSPTILSTCGIIYIESNSNDWRSYIKTHFSKHDIYNEYKETLSLLFEWAMDPSLRFIQNNCSPILANNQLHSVMSTVNLFQMYLRDALTENNEEKTKTSHFLIWAQAALILSIIWGLGGTLDMDTHVKFNSFYMSLWSGTNKDHPKPEIIKNFEITLPHDGLIQDHFYIFKGVGNWKYWGSLDVLKSEQILESPECSEIFVPTINTMKYNHILLKHMKYRRPFIVYGDVSVGKTFLIQNFLKNKLSEGMHFNWFNFISLSTVAKTQQLLLSKLNKIKKRHYGPSENQFSINFIDDLNIQRYECKSEISSILELLRQYHTYGYFYDINEPEKVFIQNIMFSLSITKSSMTKICPRFLRHFILYTMYMPATDTIFRMFSNILFINLKKNSFTADVFSTVTNITNAIIDVYTSVIKTLRPIPTKFQYLFNIRDISEVIHGCSLLQKESVDTKVTFIRLWAHEIWRVFGDRILDNEDKQWLFLQIREISKRHFKDSFETAFDYLPKCNNEITKDSFNSLIFSNFMDMGKDKNKKYEEINSIEKLKNKIVFYLNEYNNNNLSKKRIDVVVTQYVLESLIKISRILAIPRGNLLLISSVGSGRKSLATLAAYIQQQELFEPSVHSYCSFDIWRRDLKTVLQKCGGLRQDFILFLKAKQMKINFLHDISCLLATGDIPDLFSIKERCTIIEMVRLDAQDGNKNEEISNHAVMNYFLEQCRNKLHIIICFSSTNEAIRLYLHKYPELVKYCAINWHEIWPTEILTQVGLKYVQDINIEENIKINVVKACIKLHNNAKEISAKYVKENDIKIHVTLSAFFHMLKLYVHLLSKKQNDIATTRKRYLVGLEKLELAAQQVEKMKDTLTMLKPQLELSAQKMIITMREVESENISVEKATILVQQEKEIANKKTEIAGKLKMECEADLAVAIPILEDAIVALNTLKPTDITLVKAMKNPPDTVKLVMAAICVMLDVPPDKTIDSVTGKKYTDYWSSSKRILSDMNFLQILKDYDKDSIPSDTIQIIKKTYISDKNFKPHIVAKASSAAEGLCRWVRAMVSYDEIAKTVAPKKKKLFIAQNECNKAEALLNEKQEMLSVLNAKLAALNNSLQETQQQKVKLEEEVENCSIKLHKAEKLMTSLGGEKTHWIQCAENLEKKYVHLVGDMILTCGIISYIASYNLIFRNEILTYWKQYLKDLKISYHENYQLVNVLGKEEDISYWYFSGLPKNSFTLENAIIMDNSNLWPLFIDSQNQANQWIKKIEKRNHLKTIKFTDSNYLSIIQYNAENGIPTLIENVGEKLEILLDPFLVERIYNNEKCLYLDTGCNIIKYSPDFRLYITTRLLNPQFSCEIFSKLTIIDFSIPNEALQDRLLDFIMFKEMPELQGKFETLLMESVNNKKVLKQQEDIILNILSSTATNILEDEIAIQKLDSSKCLSLNIIKKEELTKKLIIVKILHPDKIILKIVQVIENTLGNTKHFSPQIKISQLYTESSCLTPLLFTLPTCITPLSLIYKFAKSKGYLSKFESLSMSIGQEEKAELLIQRAQRDGSWVFLENCHLVSSWMTRLEEICENCNTRNISLDFRLWLSTCSYKEFPISILENSVKITYDYPLNIKESLLNIYQSEPIINKEFLEGCPGKDKAFLKLLFGLCLFHTVINDRSNFGIYGWNVPYKFNHTDLQLSIMQLQNFINNTKYVPFNILLYLIGECNYGGKIQDEFDGRCLKHLLIDYCNSNIIETDQRSYLNHIEELVPQRYEYQHIIEHIKKIPLDLPPQVFGFNENGVIIRNTMIATEFLSSFLYMTSSTHSINKELQQDQVLSLIDDINDKLHDSIKINDVQDKCTTMLEEPLQRVLFCEIKTLKYILEIIRETLNDLKLALNGYLHFTDPLKELAEEIHKNRVPSIWKKVQTNIVTENLTLYIDNIVKHVDFIKNWMNLEYLTIVRFDALFHCKMAISAILLVFSKRYDIPIVEIAFDFEIMSKEDDIDAENGYLIHGLYLCGGRWDFEKNMLVENLTNETWQSMPPIRIKCSRNVKDTNEIYRCPVYVTAVQHTDKNTKFPLQNYIFSIPLRTNVPQSHWIKCGTALYCHVP